MQNCYVYLSHPTYRDDLCRELGEPYTVLGDLVLSPHKNTNVCFAQDVWLNPVVRQFDSISAAANLLRQYPVFWQEYRHQCVRRSMLIKEKLRAYREREWEFPVKANFPAVGNFTLLDQNTMLFATERWKTFPQGIYSFQEDKTNPPNRAYLKLWEALTLLQRYPGANDVVMDLGASPGGWTYVAQQLGGQVIAVDKAELAPTVAQLPRVQFLGQSAFSLKPQDFPHVNWLVADIACYPERLYALVQQWLEQGHLQQMICTIKLQGATDFKALEKFQAIPHSRVLHLFYNKHEVTFFYPAPPSLFPSNMREINF